MDFKWTHLLQYFWLLGFPFLVIDILEECFAFYDPNQNWSNYAELYLMYPFVCLMLCFFVSHSFALLL